MKTTYVLRVYHICVANPLAKEFPNCLLYPPSMTIPEACINVEDVAALLLTRDAAQTSETRTKRKKKSTKKRKKRKTTKKNRRKKKRNTAIENEEGDTS